MAVQHNLNGRDAEAAGHSARPQSGQADELLTIAEVADRLKLSRRTIWRWCKGGRLPAIRVGHQWRVRRDDLDNFVHH